MKFLRPFSRSPLDSHYSTFSSLLCLLRCLSFRFNCHPSNASLSTKKRHKAYLTAFIRECESIRVCNFTIHNFFTISFGVLYYSEREKERTEKHASTLFFRFTSFLFFLIISTFYTKIFKKKNFVLSFASIIYICFKFICVPFSDFYSIFQVEFSFFFQNLLAFKLLNNILTKRVT